MDVVINELTSTVEVAGEEMALDPTLLRQIVHAVSARLAEEEATRRWEARERSPES
jgi:hypothetical protein